MLSCPQCKSLQTKVLPLKVRDISDGKTRKRECLNCNFQFITLETMYVLPELPKPTPKIKQKRKRFSKNGKRILTPKPRSEPDFDSMTDEEIEAWVFRDD